MTTFKQIIDSGYYLAVGGYKSLDKNFTNFLSEKTGMYEPLNEFVDDKFLDLSISHEIDYFKLSKFVFDQEINTDLGQLEGTFLAQSTDYDRNYKATSGGIIKETLRYLFTNKLVEAAIVITKTGPLEYKPTKITSIYEIDDLPPSVYHMIDYTDTIGLIEEANEKNIVLVGTPWQIDGVYTYIYKKKPELKQKLYLTIGLLTGWYFSYHMIKALCKFYRLDYNNLDDLVYRGGGRTGKTRFIFKDGTEKVINRFTLRSLVTFERFFNVPKFMIEINQQNMLADLVVGDSHVPETSFSKTGISLVIARSKNAIKLLEEMKDNSQIKLLKTDDEHLIRSQKHDRLYGDFAYSYMDYLESIGEYVPKINAPNKTHHKQIEKDKLAKFHKDYKHKLELQSKGKYWQILIEKYTTQGLPLYTRLGKQIINKIFKKNNTIKTELINYFN